MLTMTNPILVILIPPPPIPTTSHNTSLAIFHCFHLSLPKSLSPSISSVFLLPAAPLSLGRLRFGVLHLSTWALRSLCSPQRRVCARVCTCARWPKRRGGGSLCSPQLKGRGITGTQTLIKAFQPPMAPLIQS